jgi:excisionase family DNA binding protein
MTNVTERPATMTVEQAGRLLGISRRSAYRAAHAGQIPVIRLGRRMLVPVGKLEELLGLTPREEPQRAGAGSSRP